MRQYLKYTTYAALMLLFAVGIVAGGFSIAGAQNVQTMGNAKNTVEILGKTKLDSSVVMLALKNTNGDTYVLTTDANGKLKLIQAPTGGDVPGIWEVLNAGNLLEGDQEIDFDGHTFSFGTGGGGSFRIVNGTEAIGKVWTCLDSDGNGTWQDPASGMDYDTLTFYMTTDDIVNYVVSGYDQLQAIMVKMSDSALPGSQSYVPGRPFKFTTLNYADKHYAKDGGNALGSSLSIGTQDNNPFYIQTNNAKVVSVDEAGKVKIGNLVGVIPLPTCAELEVSSKTGGFLPPSMTLTERNAIPNPRNGLIIYCTTDDNLHLYKGGAWKTIQAL